MQAAKDDRRGLEISLEVAARSSARFRMPSIEHNPAGIAGWRLPMTGRVGPLASQTIDNPLIFMTSRVA
jgi:hypothetical protein